jgi:hypothetical protein
MSVLTCSAEVGGSAAPLVALAGMIVMLQMLGDDPRKAGGDQMMQV